MMKFNQCSSKRCNSLLLLSLLGSLASCSAQKPLIPAPLERPRHEVGSSVKEQPVVSGLKVEASPKPPAGKLSTIKDAAAVPVSSDDKADTTLMFDQLPLPNFIQVVYGSILKVNFSLDAQVSSRTDLVTLHTAQPQTKAQIRETARMLLKSYGVAVTDVGGFYRIVPDNTMQGYAPEIRRGRALPETPLPMRPVFQLVELESVNIIQVTSFLRTLFGTKITFTDDSYRNAILISGQSEDVTAAMEAIRVLDQPLMRGRSTTRITPQYWSVTELATRLNELLSAEGYLVATTSQTPAPVLLIPVQTANALFVFTSDPAILAHVTDWAKELDKPSARGGYFTYQVHNTDAQDIAKTVRELLGAAAGAGPRIVVNAATNSLIIQGGSDYTSLLNLLQELDQPAKSVLIEVTVAEVNLTDAEQLGVEWALNNSNTQGAIWAAGTMGGLGLGAGGLTIRRFSQAGSPRMVINALATQNKARILSSPRILARNGESAIIQVGQEVPIITSQQTTTTATNFVPGAAPSAGILQSVQYKNTGVILKVKPVIHSGDRIDIDVSQEVSSAQSTTTGVTTSPTISTRKLDTKLSLKDGTTVLLGGLMSSNQNNTRNGIPLLKDIPGIGQLFRSDNDTQTKTELIVLITPYVVANDEDAQVVTSAFRERLGAWAQGNAGETKKSRKSTAVAPAKGTAP